METITEQLPQAVLGEADSLEGQQEIQVEAWSCDTYVQAEDGTWPQSGAFLFQADLAGDYYNSEIKVRVFLNQDAEFDDSEPVTESEEEDPYEGLQPVKVDSAEELLAIMDDLSGDYVLTQDISLADCEELPLAGTCFTGTLDGQGHTISDLTITSAAGTQAGLFGAVCGTVKN